MNAQERSLIEDLFNRLRGASGGQRDSEAEQLISEGMRQTPGAAYALAQTVIVQDHALREARAQIEQLQQASQNRPSGGGSFLGGLFGAGDQQQPARTSVPPSGQRGGYAPQQGYSGGDGRQGPASGGPTGSGGFLRSAAQTAAGVAGGALLFEGVRSLFGGGGFGGLSGGLGGGFGGGGPWGGQPVVNETVINEYGNDAQPFDTGSDNGWDNGGGSVDASDDGSFDAGGDGSGGDDSSWV